MTTIAWRYLMINSLVFDLLSFMLYFLTGNIIFVFIGWFFLINQLNASVRWNLSIRKDRNEGNL